MKGKNKTNQTDPGVVLQRIDETLDKLANKEGKMFFFVSDCKNIPNSNMLYVYNLARTMKQIGYDVTMLYQLRNEYTEHELKKAKRKGKVIDELRLFGGVGKWLGDSYASLPHMNVANGGWTVGPQDFLFIPEVFSSLMKDSFDRKVPCKRYVILQNFKYVTEFIPFGDSWASYGLTDAVVSNKNQADLLKSFFPYVRTNVINPFFPATLSKPQKAKTLIVNIATSKHSDAEHIIKTFYWKYPAMSFLTFRAIRNLPSTEYAEMLKEGCITIWHDPETPFGYSAIDAMKCGNIVIGKIPEIIPEWAYDGDKMLNNVMWYNNIDDIPDMLAKVVGSWMRDEIPQEVYDDMDVTANKYTYEEWEKNVSDFCAKAVDDRINEIKTKRESVAKQAGQQKKEDTKDESNEGSDSDNTPAQV